MRIAALVRHGCAGLQDHTTELSGDKLRLNLSVLKAVAVGCLLLSIYPVLSSTPWLLPRRVCCVGRQGKVGEQAEGKV